MRRVGIGLVLLLVTGLGVTPLAGEPVARLPEPCGGQALRWPDPIILDGATAGAPFLGRPAERLRVFARRPDHAALAPIPFQIDERDADGEFVFTAGPSAGRDADAGRFDANDELVLLARDAGPAALPDQRPDGADAVAAIRITDPATGADSWAYLAAYPDSAVPPPLSPRAPTSAHRGPHPFPLLGRPVSFFPAPRAAPLEANSGQKGVC